MAVGDPDDERTPVAPPVPAGWGMPCNPAADLRAQIARIRGDRVTMEIEVPHPPGSQGAADFIALLSRMRDDIFTGILSAAVVREATGFPVPSPADAADPSPHYGPNPFRAVYDLRRLAGAFVPGTSPPYTVARPNYFAGAFRVANLDPGEPMKDPFFLPDICAEPEDDTRRLAAADWYDEEAERSGAYWEAYSARAEFIRLQIGIASGPNCPVCNKVGTFTGEHRKYCELTGVDVEQTDTPPNRVVSHPCVCEYADKARRVKTLLGSAYLVKPMNPSPILNPVRVRGEELWRPAAFMSAREVRYVRGFVGVVSYQTASFMMRAETLCAAAPLEQILLCDRRLNGERPFGPLGWFWTPYDGPAPGEHVQYNFPGAVIPEVLWDLAAALREKEFAETSADAYRWLMRAALWYARAKAKLPKWVNWRESETDRFKMRGGLPDVYFDYAGEPVEITPLVLNNDANLWDRYTARERGLIEYKGFARFREGGVNRGLDREENN